MLPAEFVNLKETLYVRGRYGDCFKIERK
jgi:hypothetical protein